MEDFPTISRMPGAAGVLETEIFDPAEIAGMRAAGWILAGTAAVSLLGWLVAPSALVLLSLADLFLGVQLLRLRHTWRGWAMLRAWGGVAIGLALSISAIVNAAVGGLVLGVGQGAYSASLLLLLFGVPSMRRVTFGKITFAVSIILIIVGGVLMAAAAALHQAT